MQIVPRTLRAEQRDEKPHQCRDRQRGGLITSGTSVKDAPRRLYSINDDDYWGNNWQIYWWWDAEFILLLTWQLLVLVTDWPPGGRVTSPPVTIRADCREGNYCGSDLPLGWGRLGSLGFLWGSCGNIYPAEIEMVVVAVVGVVLVYINPEGVVVVYI